jgi:arginine decarboxylase
MKNTYFQLINQTYYFPQEGFDINNDYLTFHNYSLKYLIEKYGTPLRMTFLPRIGDQIKKAKNHFNRAIKANNYKGEYFYCYCTKCCHFSHVISEALNHGVHLETSSSFDIDLIRKLYEKGKINKKTYLIHNGHKTDDYIDKIAGLIKDDFTNVIPVLDSKHEIDRLLKTTKKGNLNVGLRMAINEEPQSAYYTSRLGIRSAEILDYYKQVLSKKKRVNVKMLHFFVDSGIRDTLYYWGEFRKALRTFAELKKICPTLDSINLGGGFPIRNNLGFEYDYKYMIDEIVRTIKEVCDEEGIDEPNIFTEFGKYTVGESGAIIFSVLEQKQQNDAELWYLIDNSLMNTIPDAWSINERFILLPVNKWNNEYTQVNIGGISCDHSDYYNSEDLDQQVFLPAYKESDKEPLYLGFFHTGAYQEAISGYGGIKHCLIPSPKHIIIERDEKGNFVDRMYRDEQTVDEMLKILGYS